MSCFALLFLKRGVSAQKIEKCPWLLTFFFSRCDFFQLKKMTTQNEKMPVVAHFFAKKGGHPPIQKLMRFSGCFQGFFINVLSLISIVPYIWYCLKNKISNKVLVPLIPYIWYYMLFSVFISLHFFSSTTDISLLSCAIHITHIIYLIFTFL